MGHQTEESQAIEKPRTLIAAGIWPPDPGGPAVHASKQYEYFKSQGMVTDVVALAHFRKWPPGVRHILYLCALMQKGIGKDLIYAHDALGVGWPAFIAARLLGAKIVVRIGGDIPWEREAETGKTDRSMKEWYGEGAHETNRAFRLSSMILKRFDAVIVPTQLLVDLYRDYYAVSLTKIHLVPNPIPAISGEAEIMERKIIYASRLVAYKNLEFVIRSLGKVFAKVPNVTFEIMGDGPERAHLNEEVRQADLTNKVVLRGRVSQEEVLRATQNCMLGLAPALTEFNPNYILQCIAFGKPFLMSRENGLPFQVPEEFLFDARNAEEFERKLTHLLSNDGYREAKEMVRAIRFSMNWERNLERNLEIVSSLV